MIKLPIAVTRNCVKKSTETHRGIQAMDETISELSLQCDPRDAARALYLISAPAEEMNMNLVKELGDYLKSIAPNSIIRSGDYPVERGLMDIVVFLWQLKELEKVKDYYTRSLSVAQEIRRKLEASANGVSLTEEAARDLPTLLD